MVREAWVRRNDWDILKKKLKEIIEYIESKYPDDEETISILRNKIDEKTEFEERTKLKEKMAKILFDM